MRKTGWIPLAASLLGGCTAGTATELAEPIRPAERIRIERIALLPVTAQPGSEDAAPVVAEVVRDVLGERAPGATIMGVDEVRDRLGRARLAATLARVLGDYEATGIADPTDLSTLADTLGTPYLLQLRVGYAESEVLREELFSEDVEDEDRREVLLVARLWVAGETGPAWEATARAGSETDAFSVNLPERTAMLRAVARRLMERIPVRGTEGGPP